VRGIKKFTSKTAKDNIEFRMKDFGIFTEDRAIEMEIFVGFGASETFMTGLRRGLLDTCVTACDGAGTVITSNPNWRRVWVPAFPDLLRQLQYQSS